MTLLQRLFALTVILVFSTNVFSQTAATEKKSVLKIKLGPFDGKNKSFLADVKKAIAFGLTVTDSVTGNKWPVEKYSLSWRKKEQTEDIQTGEKKNIYTVNSVTVRNSALIPEAWQKELQEFLQAGEQIIITDVLAKNPVTKKLRAVPNIIITAQ